MEPGGVAFFGMTADLNEPCPCSQPKVVEHAVWERPRLQTRALLQALAPAATKHLSRRLWKIGYFHEGNDTKPS